MLERLQARQLPASLASPLHIERENVAPPEKVGGAIIGGMIPYFVILFCLTGAMYPAIDLTAGEKERGTMGDDSLQSGQSPGCIWGWGNS